MAEWSDFFVAVAGAAAALAGLIIVAVSVNVADIIKYPQLLPAEEIELGEKDYPSIFPFNNEQVTTYCLNYQLHAREVHDLHAIFCSIDVDLKGFITLEGFLQLLKETEASIVYPYLKGLFKLVRKKEPDRVDFFEWYAMLSKDVHGDRLLPDDD